jgi:cyanophycinase-like exopeptidase
MFRLIVAGGRDFADYELLKTKLDIALRNRVEEGVTIVSGTARGADKLGEQYAKERGYTIDSHPADWDKYGKSAGYIRNKEMAQNADGLMAFWDGKSRGTQHMINLAKEHGLKVLVVNYSPGGACR